MSTILGHEVATISVDGFGCPITVLSVPVAILPDLFAHARTLEAHIPATSNYVIESVVHTRRVLAGSVRPLPLAKSGTPIGSHAEVLNPNGEKVLVGIDPTVVVLCGLRCQ